MGKLEVVRTEPWSLRELEAYPKYNASKPILKSAGWLPFLKKFQGFPLQLEHLHKDSMVLWFRQVIRSSLYQRRHWPELQGSLNRENNGLRTSQQNRGLGIDSYAQPVKSQIGKRGCRRHGEMEEPFVRTPEDCHL